LEDKRNKAVQSSGDGQLGAQTDEERENTSFIMDNQAQTSLLLERQDKTLDKLGEPVSRATANSSSVVQLEHDCNNGIN
jgi:hypothetical protein